VKLQNTIEDRSELENGSILWKYYDDLECTILAEGNYQEYDDFFWYKNGKFHREDGPACVYSNGEKEWCINGEDVFNSQENNLHLYDDLSEEFKMSIIKYELSK
jgi:hypothetical protein